MVVIDFEEAIDVAFKRQLPVVCIDTCVWLDIFRGRCEASEARQILSDLRGRAGNDFNVVIPDQVVVEFERNKEEVSRGYVNTLKRVASEFERFFPDYQECIDPMLILLSGDFEAHVQSRYVLPVAAIQSSAIVFKPLESHYAAAGYRACIRKAPSERKGSSSADSLILESYLGVVAKLRQRGFSKGAYFVTSNTADFSSDDKNIVHQDISSEFAQNMVEYYCDVKRFLHLDSY